MTAVTLPRTRSTNSMALKSDTSRRLVSPDSRDGSYGSFWSDCVGSLYDSLPNFCVGGPEKSVNVVKDDSPNKACIKGVVCKKIGPLKQNGSHDSVSTASVGPTHAESRQLYQPQPVQRERSGLGGPNFDQIKKSLRRTRSCSPHSTTSARMMGLIRPRQLREDQIDNRQREETREPSPTFKFQNGRNYEKYGRDAISTSDSPLLIDPPDKRPRSVPLEKLLNSLSDNKKDRGGNYSIVSKSSTQQSSLRGGVNRRIRSQATAKSNPTLGGSLSNRMEEVNVQPFATKHDEVVTALIDDALQGSSDSESDCASIYGKRTMTSNNESQQSPSSKKKQQAGSSSPSRKKISTPQWMRNRSRKTDASVSSRNSIGSGRVININMSDFFHPNCVLHKEKGSRKDSSMLNYPPSAVGREASLEKLKEKLSLLSEIESGKYGKGADMLRSDAVAFAVRGHDQGVDVAVETRSILTLRMGFVSMNYGIVLQWDYSSGLAKQIVLVKMCRDDFLERSDIEQSFSNVVSFSESDMEEDNSILISNESRTGASPGRALTDLSSSDVFGHSYLSVSILNVKQLVPVCDHPRHKAEQQGGGFSSWLCSSEQTKPSNPDHSDIRPYVRFVFGRHHHVTKSAKFNKGTITWNKRQRNSCLLPCPPEGQRWFTGQEDLIVEVRSRKISSDDPMTGGRFIPKSFFKDGHTSSQKRGLFDDPQLASVTVPLSSIIFDEEDIVDSKTSVLSRLTRCWKKNPSNITDEPPSTNITLPLPMKCCSSAPFGSISLRITMRTRAANGATPESSPPSKVKHFSSPPRTKALKTKVNGPQQVEGIELLPLTSLISSWVNDGVDESSSKNKNKAKTSKIRMGMTWSKRYDPRTKKWSNVTGVNKKSRSFRKTKEEEDDKFILFRVVDRVMGKEEQQEQERKKYLQWKWRKK